MMRKTTKIIIISFLCIIAISCSKDDDAANTPQQNEAPNAFNLVAVTNEASNVDVLPNFSWQAAIDPESDAVTYDLYLDTETNPTTLYGQNISTTNFKVEERLHLITNYFWKVIAKDSNGNTTESTINNFSTRNLNFPANPVTAAAPFEPRSEHSSVTFDDRFWILGGNTGGGNYKDDVTHTKDGINWTLSTASAPFLERFRHASVAFDDKLWVIGGRLLFRYKNDVWSSIDGINWVEVTSSASFSARTGHTTVVFNNKLWVIGGYEDGGNYKNDIWFSVDGITWAQVTSSIPFSKRANHTTVVFNDKLWVIGGEDALSGYKNDIWSSSDGINWTQETAAASFSERFSHTTVVFDEKLWLFAGFDGDIKNDVWSSTDGINWVEITNSAPFSKRFTHTTVVFDNKIWLVGGEDDFGYKNDVWVMD